MEFSDLQTAMMVVLSLCGMMIAIGGACAVWVKFWRFLHKQSDENKVTLDQVMTWLGSDKKRIEALEAQQDAMREMNRLQLRALVSLLGHEIDGNHISKLADVRDRINAYLIDKKA